MLREILSLLVACVLVSGCVSDQQNAGAGKYRKIALHGYVYSKVKTLEETVVEAKALGADGVVCSGTQKIAKRFGDAKFSPKMTAEQKEFVKKLFADNGIEFVSYGIWDSKNESPDVYLPFCKEMGIPVFTWEGNPERIGKWAEAAEKYDIIVAIHNHKKGTKTKFDYIYWNPENVWNIIKDNKRLYACADNGHWTVSGLDTPWGYRVLRGKFVAIHFKDILMPEKRAMAIGEGSLDVKSALKTLDDMGYDGYLVLENENVMNDPTETMRRSIKYLRQN